MLETLQKITSTDKVRMMDTGSQSAGNDQLHWLAGLIDGEGSIMLAARKGKYGDCYKPTFTIANTHKPTIERAAQILESNGVRVWICTNRDKRGKYPPQYSVFVTGFKRIQPLFALLENRLFTKSKQLMLLKEFCQSRSGGHPGMKYNNREKQIFVEIKTLNNSRYWFGSSETLRVALASGQ